MSVMAEMLLGMALLFLSMYGAVSLGVDLWRAFARRTEHREEPR